jgi:hypothetical protein
MPPNARCSNPAVSFLFPSLAVRTISVVSLSPRQFAASRRAIPEVDDYTALLSIAENTALFSVIGPAYGEDGQSTFALPGLRGRAPIHPSAKWSLGTVDGQKIPITAPVTDTCT